MLGFGAIGVCARWKSADARDNPREQRTMEMSMTSRAPSIQMVPTLGPKVYK